MDSGAKGKKTKPDAEAGRHATVGYRRLTIEEEVAGVPAMSRGKAALQGGGGGRGGKHFESINIKENE